jgi:hypothetical protein
VLSTRAAQALGVSEATLAHDRPLTTRGAASEQLSAHLHRFSQLEIGREIVRNPEVMVADVRLSDADLRAGDRLPPLAADLVLLCIAANLCVAPGLLNCGKPPPC